MTSKWCGEPLLCRAGRISQWTDLRPSALAVTKGEADGLRLEGSPRFHRGYAEALQSSGQSRLLRDIANYAATRKVFA